MLVELFNAIMQNAEPKEIELAGRTYTTKSVVPVSEPMPEVLEVSNLSSLIEYVEKVASRDTRRDGNRLVVHVVSPTKATVISELQGEFEDRAMYLRATEHCFWKRSGEWMNPDQFIIMLRSQFVQDQTTDMLLKIVGNIEDATVKKASDDGVSQAVTVSTGIVRRDVAAVPSPVLLTPFRSFIETRQAQSQFVLRMQSGKGDAPPMIALFEGDGGQWRNGAMEEIRAYLAARLPEGTVILA